MTNVTILSPRLDPSQAGFAETVRKASAAVRRDYVAGTTSDGRTVYHVRDQRQGTILQYWFTLEAASIYTPGKFPIAQFDIRECNDPMIRAAVAHWSGVL